ncbi:hypothetical protein CBR_g40538 [Chara braunii]|uniref:Uncharacterized protein n=1 Tax=Chara braunii TaxID=69332 RepID=A0A388K238_CHABU|nr:hypothetical protein CBR_g40538 [Chara braunii]|eukprot:GBG64089.1 hypothetical protein CBR_g40538 [Chara braunii]
MHDSVKHDVDDLTCTDGIATRNEACTLREAVDDDQDSIMTTGGRRTKRTDKVHRDGLPTAFRDGKRLEQTIRGKKKVESEEDDDDDDDNENHGTWFEPGGQPSLVHLLTGIVGTIRGHLVVEAKSGKYNYRQFRDLALQREKMTAQIKGTYAAVVRNGPLGGYGKRVLWRQKREDHMLVVFDDDRVEKLPLEEAEGAVNGGSELGSDRLGWELT